MKKLFFLPAFLLFFISCGGSGEDQNNHFNNTTNNTTNNTNNTTNNTNNTNNTTNNTNNQQLTPAVISGTVWGPGSDDPNVKVTNRFPVPGALVAVYTAGVDDPPEGNYCNHCVELPEGIAHTFTNIDGTFELEVYPNTNYKILVQKGEFRRVTNFFSPGPGQHNNLDAPSGMPTNPVLTLPNKHDPAQGSWMPKIAVIKGTYEDMSTMFEALGFDYDSDRIVEYTIGLNGNAYDFVENVNELNQYNLIVATCGASLGNLTSGSVRNNLREWVRNGGKLYIDDFSYDYAEQIWPEFLSFYVDNPKNEDNGGFGDGTGPCGDDGSNPPNSTDECNNWSSYSPSGTPEDQNLADWLNLNSVNQGESLTLNAAWDIIHELGTGAQGECSSDSNPNCVDGIYYGLPKVWVRGNAPASHNNNPMTVSWRYYCGKVLYTVYHTHSEGWGGSTDPKDYDLLLQEKIMMYLLMEIQTCVKPDIIG